MKTTVTELHATTCSRCGGRGHLPQFQYKKGGECFRCGGTGNDPVMVAVERDMTDAEVLVALEARGFPVVFAERPSTGDWLADLFDDSMPEVMRGARVMLAGL